MKNISKMLMLLFCFGLCVSSQASVLVGISAVPEPEEVVMPPDGYASCYIVPAGIYNGIWLNSHRVCEYDNAPSGDNWVAGYWGCTNYGVAGDCSYWRWYPAHWVNRGYSEYGMRVYNRPYFQPYYFQYGHFGHGYHHHHGHCH